MSETPREPLSNILERIRIGCLWQPEGLGLSYVRKGENLIKLISQENNPTSAKRRIQMRMLIEKIGWQVDESEVKLKHLNGVSTDELEMKMRQENMHRWKCLCGTPLTTFPLNQAEWKCYGQKDVILLNGEKEIVELWRVHTQCPACEIVIPLEAYDYLLLAGDDAAIRN